MRNERRRYVIRATPDRQTTANECNMTQIIGSKETNNLSFMAVIICNLTILLVSTNRKEQSKCIKRSVPTPLLNIATSY